MVCPVGPHGPAEDPGTVMCSGNPNPSHTVETSSRARPDFEFDVDSPGGTRNCALLVRGA